MNRFLITAVTLLSIVSAPAFAATAPSTPAKIAHTMTQAVPSKPTGKHIASFRPAKGHRLARSTTGHARAPKATGRTVASKTAG